MKGEIYLKCSELETLDNFILPFCPQLCCYYATGRINNKSKIEKSSNYFVFYDFKLITKGYSHVWISNTDSLIYRIFILLTNHYKNLQSHPIKLKFYLPCSIPTRNLFSFNYLLINPTFLPYFQSISSNFINKSGKSNNGEKS